MQLHQQFTTISYRLQISAENLSLPAFLTLPLFSAYRNERNIQGYEMKCKKEMVCLNLFSEEESDYRTDSKRHKIIIVKKRTEKDTIPSFLMSEN